MDKLDHDVGTGLVGAPGESSLSLHLVLLMTN